MKRKILSFLVVLIFFQCIIHFTAAAQDTVNIFSNPPTIDPKRLTGIWQLADSNIYTIEFIYQPADFMMKMINQGTYYFSKDSTGFVYSRGYMPAWPPFDCDLNLLNNDSLKITFSQMGYPGVSYLYVRNKK